MAKNKLLAQMSMKKSAKSSAPPAKPKQPEAANTVKAAPAGHSDMERRYRAEEALRDMTRVAGHKKDKALMKEVHKLASEHMATANEALSGGMRGGKKK